MLTDMTDQESIEVIASNIHRLHKSYYIDQPLLPLLLLSNVNPVNQDNFSAYSSCINNTDTTVSSNTNNNSNAEQNKFSTLCQHQHRNDSSKLTDINLIKNWTDTKECTSFRRLLTTYWCPKSLTCTDILLEQSMNSQYFSTGIVSLDNLLGGEGLRTGEITEVIGKSSTCKTQLCLSVCASLLQSCQTSSIIYLDTKGDFIPSRLEEYLIKRLQKCTTSRGIDVKQCLTRLRYCLVPTISHLIDALITIRMYIDRSQHDRNNPSSSPINQFFNNCKLVIIDSLTMPYLIYMATLSQLDYAVLCRTLKIVSRIDGALLNLLQ
ncbi:unnamed protein product [Heterobilharzia americana]|nr:unnamed protein product [Heterobilharzia americana]